jgi:restriction system protein
MMKYYYRVMLGKGSAFAKECIQDSFIGADFGITQDLTGKLTDDWRAFNSQFIPIYRASFPEKTKVAAGLSCGALWTVSIGLKAGDIVISPDGAGHYHVGEVIGDYFYKPGGILPHRRQVHWFEKTIERAQMSEALRRSAGSYGTTCNISSYSNEIESLLGGTPGPEILAGDQSIEDPAAFVMEKHLEDFLVQNWAQTELGKLYNIYEVDGELAGQQYQTDTGPIDVLAISKDKKTLLVVELKKGRASDVVVGQILRYMGYVQDVLADPGQTVKGVIIALEDDQRIRRALAMVPSITFYRYQVSFKLVKAS